MKKSSKKLFVLGAWAAACLAAAPLPPRQAGLWQSTAIIDGAPQIASALCVDPATDLDRLAGRGRHCGKPDIKPAGAGYTMDNTCTAPDGAPMTVHAIITYRSAEELDIQSTMASKRMTMTLSIVSKFIGPCPPGIRPGDNGTMHNGTFQKTGNVNTTLQ